MVPWPYIYDALASLPFEYLYIAGVLILILFLIWWSSRPRRFYFVRHGETVLNAAHVRQGDAGSLSENGQHQAEEAGKFLAHFPIKLIIASPYERTRETAAIINTYLKVPIIYSPLIVERRNPSQVIGRNDNDPEIKHIIDLMDRAYHDDTYRFSDEENFIDLKARAKTTLHVLARQGHRQVCVVTHSIFLKMLIAYLLYREEVHAEDYIKLSFFNASDNAGITVCDFYPFKVFSPTHGWKVIEYNLRPY